MSHFLINSVSDADRLMGKVFETARLSVDHLTSQSGDALHIFHLMKFEKIGVHPLDEYPLNLVEQINQTWTYAVAIAAARKLLQLHPEVGGFKLAPGAHASLDLDIMSNELGMVGAETFAAVNPSNNGKLKKDLEKLAKRPEVHRYVFFMSPMYPGEQRLPNLEKNGVQVWSLDPTLAETTE